MGAKNVKKGAHTKKRSKVWNKVTFRRPKTLTLARKPIAPVKSVKKESTWDKYAVVKYPLSSESAIKTIEDHNTLVFLVDKRATKPTIKKASRTCTKSRLSALTRSSRQRGRRRLMLFFRSHTMLLKLQTRLESCERRKALWMYF